MGHVLIDGVWWDDGSLTHACELTADDGKRRTYSARRTVCGREIPSGATFLGPFYVTESSPCGQCVALGASQ